MNNSYSNQKTGEVVNKFADRLIFKTILYNLSNDDTRVFLNYLSVGKFIKAEKLIKDKIPNLEEKIEDEKRKRLKNIFQRIKNK